MNFFETTNLSNLMRSIFLLNTKMRS